MKSQLELKSFQHDLDELFRKTRAQLGKQDIDHIAAVARFSTVCEWTGRALLYLSFEPISFILGTFILWVHKQLEVAELGHNIQHGTYETIHAEGSRRFTRRGHRWRFHARIPVHAPSWCNSHNRLHHGLTNVVGHDPDARLFLRSPEHGEFRWHYRLIYLETLFNWPNIIFNASAAASGLFEAYGRRPIEDLEILRDRSWASIFEAHRRAFAGCILYFLREYVFFPALAGPHFAKILLGNWLSSLMRNLFTAPALYAAHISPEVATYPKDTRARSRAQWYEMQVLATQNFEVHPLVSILVGGLDYQIEHHLFPSLPPNRLREIAPEVRRICEKHGVRYHSRPWYQIYKLIFVQLHKLSRPPATEAKP